MSNPEMVVAVYRPHEGKASEVERLLERHVPTLQALELATERPAIVARAADGTYLEVFEWRSAEAAGRAHDVLAVAELWAAMGQVADFKALADLEEARRPFSHFSTIG